MAKTGRNERCGCGSGLKAKRCCGVARGPSGESLAVAWLRNAARGVAEDALALSEREIDDLVAFLASLTNPQYKEAGDKEYARQLALSKVTRPQRDTERAFGPKPPLPKPPPL